MQAKKRPRRGRFQVFGTAWMNASFACRAGLNTVIHVELERMCGHAEARDILHLERNVGIDQIVGEYAALGQEFTVLVQGVQRLVEGATHGRDLFLFFRWQIMQASSLLRAPAQGVCSCWSAGW